MQELSKSQKARRAIASFKTLVDALILTGSYHPSGTAGIKLENAMRQFNPEIYGTMGDDRIVELKGLEYVIDRLPRGIESSTKIVLTAREELESTSFEEILPLKRRRRSYLVSDKEMCFVVTRGTSEIYDIIAHLTFLNIEAQKISRQVKSPHGLAKEWQLLEQTVQIGDLLQGEELDASLWNLSIILGRTYKDTRKTFEYLEQNSKEGYNSGLLRIVQALGQRVIDETEGVEEVLHISFTPSLQEVLGHHQYAAAWAESLVARMIERGLQHRPIHIISANLHAIRNILYGRGALEKAGLGVPDDLYDMIHLIRDQEIDVGGYAAAHGFIEHPDSSGSSIDVQIIDTTGINASCYHPSLQLDLDLIGQQESVIVVIDYAFGTQAYEIMDELLSPTSIADTPISLKIESVSIMGKAGILPGSKGDIMLATAHVVEGTPHNYIVNNDLSPADFGSLLKVFSGPMLTVLGTSLQNRDVLERFHNSSWKAVGLEMEGAHYQRAISAAIIQEHIPKNLKVRYAYYASDNPLISGQTLASGPMGAEGVVPTYLIAKVILEKILAENGNG
ncbi:MAG: hypothetical protein KJO28_12810 [Desulfofustis sp.]|nr:hypothetical protein [Desulfofustis sp.]